jgi:prophage regulatory protein
MSFIMETVQMREAAVKKVASKTISEILGANEKPFNPLVGAAVSDMLLRVHSVGSITGLSTATIYRLMAKGEFPRPFKITGYARAWRLTEIMAWIDSRDREGAL